jgi:TatD DNase family protein
VIAVGECGLDYDRLQFCPKEVQQRYFEVQLELAKETGLPLFLHNRGTGGDFLATMRRLRSPAIQGVVHSYDGGVDEMLSLCNECGLYIGVNGCSMKTEENLEVVRQIPIDRLMIETDAPWCDIRPTHASSKWISASSRLTTAFPQQKKERFQPGQMVKGRNEPCQVRQILSIIANLRGVSEEQLAETVYQNTLRLFFPDEL